MWVLSTPVFHQHDSNTFSPCLHILYPYPVNLAQRTLIKLTIFKYIYTLSAVNFHLVTIYICPYRQLLDLGRPKLPLRSFRCSYGVIAADVVPSIIFCMVFDEVATWKINNRRISCQATMQFRCNIHVSISLEAYFFQYICLAIVNHAKVVLLHGDMF